MATIIIPTPLRKFTNNQSQVSTQGTTIEAAIAELTQQHADLQKHLIDEQGKVRSFIRIYLGDEDINSLEKEATLVADKDIISIVPAIAGGI